MSGDVFVGEAGGCPFGGLDGVGDGSLGVGGGDCFVEVVGELGGVGVEVAGVDRLEGFTDLLVELGTLESPEFVVDTVAQEHVCEAESPDLSRNGRDQAGIDGGLEIGERRIGVGGGGCGDYGDPKFATCDSGDGQRVAGARREPIELAKDGLSDAPRQVDLPGFVGFDLVEAAFRGQEVDDLGQEEGISAGLIVEGGNQGRCCDTARGGLSDEMLDALGREAVELDASSRLLAGEVGEDLGALDVDVQFGVAVGSDE